MKTRKKYPDPVDVHVGALVRFRRKELGISQDLLGKNLGVTFQQIQKYEKGSNRIGASRLQAIGRLLGVPVSFFFENAPTQESCELVNPQSEGISHFLSSDDALQLNRAYSKIDNKTVKRKVLSLVMALAGDH